jgi:hypothetical protein
LTRKGTKSNESTGVITNDQIVVMMNRICEMSGIYRWVPGGVIEIKNSDGSITVDSSGRLTQGLMRTRSNGSKEDIIPCYEFNGGICLHSDGGKELMDFCQMMAKNYDLDIKIV